MIDNDTLNSLSTATRHVLNTGPVTTLSPQAQARIAAMGAMGVLHKTTKKPFIKRVAATMKIHYVHVDPVVWSSYSEAI